MASDGSRGLRVHNRGATLRFVLSHILLRTPELTLGEFECAPGDPLWDEVNTNMGAWPHVVFPRTPRADRPGGRAAGAGDAQPRRLLQAAPALPRGAARPARRPLPVARGLARAVLRLPRRARRAVRRRERTCSRSRSRGTSPTSRARSAARRGGRADAARRRSRRCACPPERARAREHAELAEAAKELARGAHAHEPSSLAAVAAALYVSPFHLARVFRARTGFSLSGYVHGLRLRRAVERLAAEPGVELSRLRASSSATAPRATSAIASGRRSAPPPSALRGTRTAHDRGSARAPRAA